MDHPFTDVFIDNLMILCLNKMNLIMKRNDDDRQ